MSEMVKMGNLIKSFAPGRLEPELMENETKGLKESQGRVKAEGEGLKQPESPGQTSAESKAKTEKEVEPPKRHILRVYNVPPEYTPSRLKELVEENCKGAQILEILPPNPWDDKVDTCWILICKDAKTHSSLLSLEEVWLKPDKSDKGGTAVSFLAGDELDLGQIPSKLDEQLLLADIK